VEALPSSSRNEDTTKAEAMIDVQPLPDHGSGFSFVAMAVLPPPVGPTGYPSGDARIFAEANCLPDFPATNEVLPDRVCKFPVPMRREFLSLNGSIPRESMDAARSGGSETQKSLFFSLLPGNSPIRDGFAQDCPLRHLSI
jgi:hypothetical protein